MNLAPGWEVGAILHGNERTAVIVSLSEELCEISITADSSVPEEERESTLPMTWTGTLSDLFCGWRLA